MKKFYSLLFYSFLLFSYGNLTAQDIDIPVRFAAGNFITGNNIRQQSFQKQELQASLFNNDYYVLVQFSKLPSLPVQQNLRKAGLNLETYIPGNAYLSTVSNGYDFTKAGQSGIISVNIIPAFYKIDKAFSGFREAGNKDAQLLMAVSYYTSVNRSVVIEALLHLGALIIPTKFLETNVVFIQVDTGKINAIAALPFVSYISLQSLLSPSGKNLNGKGIVVGVGDNSEIITPHIDFNSRVINRVPFPFSFHGIHVSGTVAGAGLLDPKHNGMAPRATIVSQYFSDIITAAPTYVADYNMVVTNNSYTNAQDSCAGSGAYDVVSNYIDRQMGAHEKLLHVFAAGNDGRNTCSPYPYGYATIKSGYQVAKNVLTVGSVDTLYGPAFLPAAGR
ncbi:MAG: S8 family serine peptidase [Chitinophagaceae bacterium]|nr:S8 family serine peptidase [Chitinophagaceae bacterium]